MDYGQVVAPQFMMQPNNAAPGFSFGEHRERNTRPESHWQQQCHYQNREDDDNPQNSSYLSSTNLRKFNRVSKVDENSNQPCRNLHSLAWNDTNEDRRQQRVLDSENDANRRCITNTQYDDDTDADACDEYGHEEYNELECEEEESGQQCDAMKANDAYDDDNRDDDIEVEYADIDDLDACVCSLQALMADLQNLQQDISMQETENKAMEAQILSLDEQSKNLGGDESVRTSQNAMDTNLNHATDTAHMRMERGSVDHDRDHGNAINNRPNKLVSTQVSRNRGIGMKRRYNDAMQNEYDSMQTNKRRRISTPFQQRQFCG